MPVWHGLALVLEFEDYFLHILRGPKNEKGKQVEALFEASALGWLDIREVRLRNGQMGSHDYPNTLPAISEPLQLRVLHRVSQR
jgi:hypothetical protein